MGTWEARRPMEWEDLVQERAEGMHKNKGYLQML